MFYFESHAADFFTTRYSTMSTIASKQAASYSSGGSSSYLLELGVKKARTEEEYFNDDDDDYDGVNEEDNFARGDERERARKSGAGSGSEEEEDALDAFMANLEKDAMDKANSKTKKAGSSTASSSSSKLATTSGSKKMDASSGLPKGVRDDIEEADDEESYYKWLEENPNAGRLPGGGEE